MDARRLAADEQPVADLLVRESGSNKSKDVDLSAGRSGSGLTLTGQAVPVGIARPQIGDFL